MLETIHRIVGSTDGFDIIFSHQSAGTEFGSAQFGGAFVKNFPGCFRFEYFIHTKRSFEFQVSPVIQGITHGIGKGFGPFFEFFPVAGILTGAITFINSVGSHGTPFIMVTFEPDLSQVVEFVIFGNVFGVQVAVIINNRQIFGVLVEKLFGYFVFQHKIFVHECFHSRCIFEV